MIGYCKGRRESSPEKPFPRREVSALEECVFQNTFHTTQGLNHVCTVVVQVPELPIMPLMCPPERVLLQDLDGKATTIKFLSAYYPRFPARSWTLLIQGKFLSSPPCTWYCLKSVRTRQPLSYANVCLSFWKRVLIRGMPRSHESSKSSKVSRLSKKKDLSQTFVEKSLPFLPGQTGQM